MNTVHVVGAGGIGCAVGYALRHAGVDVTFVDADAAKVEWGRRHGVAVDRRPPCPAAFTLFADWEPPAGGIVLLTTKCYDNATVLARLSPAAVLLPIQNGFDTQLMARPPHVEGIASFVSECLPHRTHTRITRRGGLHLGPSTAVPGEDGEGLRKQVRRMAEWLRQAPFRVRVVDDIRPYKHTKLMYNAAISPLAAAAGMDNGDLLRLPRARRLFFALLRENHAILDRAGVPLGKVGPLHPATVARILKRPFLAHAFAWIFYPTLRGTYCSMAGDLPAGPTEIDYYNRYLIDLAGDFPCPLNRAVHALVKRMEREHTPPHTDALSSIADCGAYPQSERAGSL